MTLYQQPGLDGFGDAAEAMRRRDEGIERAVEHADEVEPRWSLQAFALLAAFIIDGPREFTSGDVTHYASARGFPEPPDGRAWGSVFQRASKAGWIRSVGYVPHPDPSRHHAPCRLWLVLG